MSRYRFFVYSPFGTGSKNEFQKSAEALAMSE